MSQLLSPAESEALLLSLRVSGVAVLAALPFAFLTALSLTRFRLPAKPLFDGLIHLPLVLPPVAMGFLLLVVFGTHGAVGGWLEAHFGIRFVFRWTGAALASAVITFPLQVRAIRQALESTDARLGEAAATLGARLWDRLVNLTVPLAWPGILSGLVTAFAASLGEFGAIITFASNIPGETQTLPLAIYAALQEPGGEAEAARLCLLSVLLALLVMTAGELVKRGVRDEP